MANKYCHLSYEDRKNIESDEKFLRQISSNIDFKNDNYLEIINVLKQYCLTHYCFALAPVQIGIPKRLIYIKNTSSNMDKNFIDGYNESVVYINPVILNSYGHTFFLEGCESCMYVKDGQNIHYVSVIDRPYKIDIEYQDINGKKRKKTLEGFETTIFCHEYDHLNGIVHMDRAEEVYEMTPEQMNEFRKNNPYKIISKDEKYNNYFLKKKL